MNNARFPSTHMILPEFRHISLKPQVITEPLIRIKNQQEFQRLIELSLLHGIVLQILTRSEDGGNSRTTTGIVKQINPHSGIITIHTLEGIRNLNSRDVCDVISAE